MADKKKFQLSLGTQVLLAFVLGLAMGVFFGETVGFLKNVGRAFILLQMTVLPYITLSLITGLGQLTYQQVKELVLKAGAVLVFSWRPQSAAAFRLERLDKPCLWQYKCSMAMRPSKQGTRGAFYAGERCLCARNHHIVFRSTCRQ